VPRRRREGKEPEDFLRLPGDTFDVLVSLADEDRHGYAILLDIAERSDGRIRLSPSTLYAVIKRLLESELIEELSERPDPAHDDVRRRYYRLTPLGRRVAQSEAARLTRLLADARVTGLVPKRRSP
jgi:DNA-binding PadR family transcriptional regulator